MSNSEFKVGQRVVLYITANRRSPTTRDATITKVGRRWVSYRYDEIDLKGRFDRNTMRIDAGEYTSPGIAYLSMDELTMSLKKSAVVGLIMSKISTWSLRAHLMTLSAENIEAVARLLGVDIGDGFGA